MGEERRSPCPISTLVLVLFGLVIVVAIGVALWFGQRMLLRRRFGPEYDRVLAEHEKPALADRELRERVRRHAGLRLRSRRQAMVHYRAFVAEVLGTDPTPAAHIEERSSHARRPVDQ